MKPKIVLLAMSLFLLIGCLQKNVEPGACTFKTLVGSAKKLEGKWKLVKVTTSGFSPDGVQIFDNTCEDIIYEYREEGKLVVYRNGVQEYEWEYTVEREKGKITKINSGNAKITATKLTIDSRTFDGPLEEFYRVK